MKDHQACLLALLAVAGNAAANDTDAMPVTNPFERPAWLSEARETREAVGVARPARIRLDLRATLLGEPSLANVGGRILQPGDVVAGYTLLSVSEGAAQFSDGEKTFEVRVRPQSGEDADD